MVTVSELFHIFTLNQKMIDTPEGYKRRIDAVSAEYLKAATDISASSTGWTLNRSIARRP
jgi:hypothetical protein